MLEPGRKCQYGSEASTLERWCSFVKEGFSSLSLLMVWFQCLFQESNCSFKTRLPIKPFPDNNPARNLNPPLRLFIKSHFLFGTSSYLRLLLPAERLLLGSPPPSLPCSVI